MGREIRRVPPNWQHPKDERGQYRPLYDAAYATQAREWLNDCLAWENGTHPLAEEFKAQYPFWWEWNGNPPRPEDYRPAWAPEEATAYQMYETVTEGTPVSPVFETLDQLEFWLVNKKGHSREAAAAFVKSGWAPSGAFMVNDAGQCTGFAANIEALTLEL